MPVNINEFTVLVYEIMILAILVYLSCLQWLSTWEDHEKLQFFVAVIKLCDEELVDHMAVCVRQWYVHVHVNVYTPVLCQSIFITDFFYINAL